MRRTGLYVSLLGISGALYLSVFEQPEGMTFFDILYSSQAGGGQARRLLDKVQGLRMGKAARKSWGSELCNDSNRSGVTAGEDDGAAVIVKNEQPDHESLFRKDFRPTVGPLQDDHPAAVNRFFNAC